MKPLKNIRGAYNPDNKVYRVVLIDCQDKYKNQLTQTLFKNQCKINGIPIEKETRYSSDMYFYRVSLDSLDKMELIQEFEGVLFIEEAIPVSTLNNMAMPAAKVP